MDAGQGLPGRDWAGESKVLPTQMFINSNLVTSEIFVRFHQSVQKLFRIFLTTDSQTSGYPDTQTPHKMNHPTALYG